MIKQIIAQIWELSWYEVLIIAVVDDLILFIKLWPIYVGLIIGGFILRRILIRNKK